jgi:hypothetical protein
MAIQTRKDGSEEIRVSRGDYKGSEYIHIRKFFRAESGEFFPTKKGITFPSEFLDDLRFELEKV